MVTKKIVNPFKPTAGAEPPILVGRERVIEDFRDGIDEGVGAPGRLMRITGPRGSGKTVLLTELGDIARAAGWSVIDVAATIGLLEKIKRAAQVGTGHVNLEVEANLGIVTAHAEVADATESPDLREVLTRAATKLTDKSVGLLITVDEVQDGDENELRELATTVQHMIRERLNIAFVFAGITTGVMSLINGKALTFLRRAKSEDLASIPTSDVAVSFEDTFANAGLDVAGQALQSMAEATQGYAYLIQLVGYGVFAEGRKHASTSTAVTSIDVRRGIERAYADFSDAVLLPALDELPLRSIEYLIAMTEDADKSGTGTIAGRLGLDPSQLTATRRQLIERQVIEAPSRGLVRFAIPLLREYLVENKEEVLSRF